MPESEIANTNKVEAFRPLGALEHLFWLIDQRNTMHFAVIAEIAGTPSRDDWRRALDQVQRRHPMLRVRVNGQPSRVPWFNPSQAAIPLKFVEGESGTNWDTVVGQELANPFDSGGAPLVRAVVINRRGDSTLILVAHHSIADGMSLVYVIRDTLLALSGTYLEPLPMLPSLDDLLAGDSDSVPDSPGGIDEPSGPAGTFTPRDGTPPKVEYRCLEPGLATNLRNRARQEGTTVHGALCAALVTAGRQLSDEWRTIPVRVLSPFDSRPLLSVNEDCGLLVSAVPSVFECEVVGFWDLARHATVTIRAGRNRRDLRAFFSFIQQITGALPDVAAACEFSANAYAREAIVTNLGTVPIDSRYGDFELKALWGPIVLSGFVGDQSISVATLGGSVRLTHTSHTPIAGLLAGMERTLNNACSHS